ncbi:MAG: hypothetical protein CMF51_00875 [Legionellales bacterium]|nr:hypothetical protein [Legionellales bacterium]
MSKTITLVYDGNCPLCKIGSKWYRLRQGLGDFNLVDARTQQDHPIIQRINTIGFDLDEGMVIEYHETLYHGVDALKLMAKIGSNQDLFNRIHNAFYRLPFTAELFYPLLKAGRNIVLKLKGLNTITGDTDA